MTQSRKSIPLAFSTQKACQQSNQLSSEQERAADLRNSMLSRLQDAASKKVPILGASARDSLLRRELIFCGANALEGGHESCRTSWTRAFARHVPSRARSRRSKRALTSVLGALGSTMGRQWLNPGSSSNGRQPHACSACGPSAEGSTDTNF